MRLYTLSRALGFLFVFTIAVFAWADAFAQNNSARTGTVTIATIEREPFAMKDGDDWTGFSIELWHEIAADLNLQTRFVEKQNFGDLIGSVTMGTVHGAIANISVTEERERRLDFSVSIFDAGIQVMTKSSAGLSDVFAAIFNRELMTWVGGALVILFIAANLIWLAERPKGGHEAFSQRGYRGGVGRGLWWAMNVLTQSSFEVASPQTRIGRFVGVVIVVFGLFVVSAFVAQITATLTVRELTTAVTDLSDLKLRRVGTTTGSTSARFLDANGVGYKGYENIDAMFEGIENGELDAIVHDAPILAYYVLTRGQGRYALPARVFKKEKYAIALNENSLLIEDVNRALLRMREDGRYDQIAIRWFGDSY